MPMQDVKSAHDLDDLKRMAFVNFHEIEKKLNMVNDEVKDFTTSRSASPGGGAANSNTFDTVYLQDANTYITRSSSGDLVFHDAKAGSITLSQIKVMLAILWTYGDAVGIKFTNLAGTERMVGITEDADGVTLFYNESEVE